VAANTIVAIYVDGAKGRALVVPEIAVQRERGLLKVVLDGKVCSVKVPYCWI
jgi:hypothetical protein